MIYLVMGSQNSGKSVLAEDLAMRTGDRDRIYLATMKVCDDAGKERIIRHRKQREGKGFVTIERQRNIADAISEIERPKETTVLLECVANLVGNEMYDGAGEIRLVDKTEFSGRVADEVKLLGEQVHNLIIVTNTYSGDAEGYDDATRLYVELLDMVNERVMDFADEVMDLRGTLA